MTPTLFHNSPYFPLPEDYPTLSPEGQRLARVNATRIWTIPNAKPQYAVAALRFFDLYYLHPDPAGGFDPLFYDAPPRETPAFHDALVAQWYGHRYSVGLAPRGGAKSTLIRKSLILELVSGHAHSCVYATSTHDNAKHTGQLIKDQCYNNSRIFDDFGNLKPSRGERPTGVEYFFLTNGAYLRCVSAESRVRGIRPKTFALDDPEYDEKASTSLTLIRDYMDRLIFRLCIPMVLRGESTIRWLGTFVSKRHYLWHAMSTHIDPVTGATVSEDPRFNYWSKLWVRAATEDPTTGAVVSCWPDMWPATIAEKIARNTPSLVSLEEMKGMMGSAAFNNEMLGRPGESSETFFKLDPSPSGKHAYWFTEPDTLLSTEPRQSLARINWVSAAGPQSTTIREFLSSCRLFITVDTAFTETSHSDRRVATLLAATSANELFVLDMESSRCTDSALIQKTLGMSARWGCSTIFVEVVRESFKLYTAFSHIISTRMSSDMGFTQPIALRDLRPGTLEKSSKIAALEPRFEWALIKLPFHARSTNPGIRRLFEQIEGFNPEAANGGLDHDDELDTVSMSLQALRGRISAPHTANSDLSLDPFDLLARGIKTLPGGASIAQGLPLQSLTADQLNTLLAAQSSPTVSFPVDPATSVSGDSRV